MNTPADERLCTGIVFEPDVVDASDCIYSAEVIRAACEDWNRQRRHTLGDVTVTESRVTDADSEIGGRVIKAGSWLVTVRVEDEAHWQRIIGGEVTGLSIGGWAVKVPPTE